MDKQTLQELLTKYRAGEATNEEEALVDAWYNALDAEIEPAPTPEEKQALLTRNWHRLEPQTTLETKIRRLPVIFYRNLAVTTVIALIIGLGWFLLTSTTAERTMTVDKRSQAGKLPRKIAASQHSTIRRGGQLRYPAVRQKDSAVQTRLPNRLSNK